MTYKNDMKYLSLFSGIGGFELGIQQAYGDYIRGRDGDTEKRDGGSNPSITGLEATQESPQRPRNSSSVVQLGDTGPLSCIGFSEIDKYAIQIYERHFPDHKNYGDITKIMAEELPDFDFLCGGFPCQSFSIAGKRRGFEDTRGTLFFDIARIIKSKRPSQFLLENVKGLLSHDAGRTFHTIIQALDELGYDLQWQVLNSKDFGVPQNRERVFIVGHLRGTSRPEVFPFGSSDQEVARGYEERRSYLVEASRRHEQREYKEISPTVQSSFGTGGGHVPIVMPQIRRLTPTECERLQGFPDGWTEGVSDTQRYKCLGNAVTVNVIKTIMSKLTPSIPRTT